MSSSKPAARPASEGPQDVDVLKKRFETLSRQKTIAETNLANAQRSLDDLKRKARADYGTDDLEQLKVRLSQMQQENTGKRADYQQALDKIEADLKALEQHAQEPPAGGEAR